MDPEALRREFNYRELTAQKKLELLKELEERLRGVADVSFAYVHGSFVERSSIRDLDVAVWLTDTSRAFYYTVDFSVRLEVEMRFPVDVQVLNTAPLPFKFHVFTRGQLIFSRDESLRLRLVDETLRQYFDLKLLNETASRRL